MVNRFRRGAAYLSCVVLLGWSVPLASGTAAYAADPPGVSGPPSGSVSFPTVTAPFSLLVSPTRLVMAATDIGRAEQVMVVNRGKAPLRITVRKQNFAGAVTGAMDFQADAPYAAADWLSVRPATFDLAPDSTRTVTAVVTVPTHPEPGDHEVALVFLVPAGTSGANIRINRGIAVPMYITVPGPTDDTAWVSDLTAPGFVLTGGPVDVSAQVHDSGTVHRDFRGDSRLAVDVGGTKVDFPEFTVLRGSTRDVATTWHPPIMCVCHASVSVVDEGGIVRTASVSIIVFPLIPVCVVIVVLVLLVLGWRWWRRRQRVGPATGALAGDGGGDA